MQTHVKNQLAWQKSSRKKEQIKLDKHTMTVEVNKRQHSMILSQLHEEVQPRLREILMRHQASATKIEEQGRQEVSERRTNRMRCQDLAFAAGWGGPIT